MQNPEFQADLANVLEENKNVSKVDSGFFRWRVEVARVLIGK